MDSEERRILDLIKKERLTLHEASILIRIEDDERPADIARDLGISRQAVNSARKAAERKLSKGT